MTLLRSFKKKPADVPKGAESVLLSFVTENTELRNTAIKSAEARAAAEARSAAAEETARFEKGLREAAQAETALHVRMLAFYPSVISIDRVYEVQGRGSVLSPVEYVRLKDSLRKRGLMYPLAVRERPNGRYELIAGHNRLRALRELGQPTVRMVKLDVQDEDIEHLAYELNKVRTSQPDFAEFCSLRIVRSASTPELTPDELSEVAGRPVRRIHELFAYERLPPSVQAVLEQHPTAFSAANAAKLASLFSSGVLEDRILTAVNMRIAGRTQSAAVAYAAGMDHSPRAVPKAERLTIRNGRATACTVEVRGNSVRLDFKNDLQMSAAMPMLLEHLRRLLASGNA